MSEEAKSYVLWSNGAKRAEIKKMLKLEIHLRFQRFETHETNSKR
jgi:hypothetical protein